MKTHEPIPVDYEVQPIQDCETAEEDFATCGHCGLNWDDGISTSMTPAPSGHCPFEAFHVYPDAASAPTLLASLERCVFLLERITSGDHRALDNAAIVIDEANAAIATAGGPILT